MILRELLRDCVVALQSAGIESASLDARLLMQDVLGCDHAGLIRRELDVLTEAETALLDAHVTRRLNREPLSHILKKREFWKDTFFVNADVLDPRPDSETLIEALIRFHPDPYQSYSLLDLGTGSGCLILSALREFPNATATAVDLSEAALSVAAQNAESLGLANRITFMHDNWGKTLQTQYDMIMSNPPYIAENDILGLAPEVRQFEPWGALSGGADGLQAYLELLPQIKRLLKISGLAVIELGAGQDEAVCEIACKASLNVVDVIPDLAGVQRVLVVKQ